MFSNNLQRLESEIENFHIWYDKDIIVKHYYFNCKVRVIRSSLVFQLTDANVGERSCQVLRTMLDGGQYRCVSCLPTRLDCCCLSVLKKVKARRLPKLKPSVSVRKCYQYYARFSEELEGYWRNSGNRNIVTGRLFLNIEMR